MAYYYTPVIVNSENGQFDVAKTDDGETVSAMPELVAGIHTLKLDRDVGRYVLDCPENQEGLSGWDLKTREEVNADYPGLIRG